MNYVVFDLEWNSLRGTKRQACYYNRFNDKTKSFDEIIEIGAIKLNHKLEYIDSFRMYIKPTIYKKLNPRIVELTSISDEDLEYGFEFKKVFKYFRKWLGRDYILCSWCDSDIKVLKKNISYYNPNYKIENLLLPYIDIQRYCCEILGYDRRISLSEMVTRECGIIEIDSFHQALEDTKATVEIFREVFDEEKVKEYIINDIHYFHDSSNLEITIDELDKSQLRSRCVSCGRYNKKIKMSLNRKKRVVSILSYCKVCRTFTNQKIKIKRDLSGDLVYDKKRKKIMYF